MKKQRDGVPCPKCGGRLSRVRKCTPTRATIRRKRRCTGCAADFVTVEAIQKLDTHVLMDTHVRDLLEKLLAATQQQSFTGTIQTKGQA